MILDANITRFRDRLAAYVGHHLATGDRILISRSGKALFAVVSVEDLRRLETTEVEGDAEQQAGQARALQAYLKARDGMR